MAAASLTFLGGLAILLASGEMLVRATLNLAQKLQISPLAAGLTLTAIATSAPEAFVCIEATLNHQPDIAVGNIIGSNVANLLLVLGIPALLFSFPCNAPLVRRNALIGTAATITLFPLAIAGYVGKIAGAALIAAAILTLAATLQNAKRKGIAPQIAKSQTPATLAAALAIIAAIGLHFGAEWLIKGATLFAEILKLPPAVIALSLVALGTSLPELAASTSAARQGRADLALGNILGSNILNVFGILGLSALAGSLPVRPAFLAFDLWILLAATVATLPFFLTRRTIPRSAGALFLLAYGTYLASLPAWHGAEFPL